MATAATTAAGSGNSSWLEKLARLGFASRGVIYMLIGVMAVLAAVGPGGQTEGTKGTLQSILSQTGGWIFVAVLALGLAGYAMWRFCEAIMDADNFGKDAKGLTIRTGFLISGLAHAALAVWAGKAAFGYARGGGRDSEETAVAWLMAKPFGQWLVGLAGLIVIGVGIAQLVRGHKNTFERHLTWSPSVRRKLSPVCTFGLYARGVVFAIIGSFIVYAAITTNPNEAGGVHEALDWLRSQPYGPWLLGAVAVGLAAYGAFSIIEAIYRRVNPPA